MRRESLKIVLSLWLLCIAGGAGLWLPRGRAQNAPPPKQEERERRGLRDAPSDPKNEAAAIEFLNRFRPDVAQRLRQIKRDDPRRYAEILRDAARESMELDELKRVEPQAHVERVRDLEEMARLHRLAAEWQTAPANRKDATRKQLTKRVGERFDQRQRLLEAELDELERRVGEVREKVRLHRAEKDRLVNERLKQLLDSAQIVYW